MRFILSRQMLCAFLAFMAISCSQVNQPKKSFSVETAIWLQDDKSLLIQGKSPTAGEQIRIKNAINDNLIASSLSKNDNAWDINVPNLQTVPCNILIISKDEIIKKPVQNTPTHCDKQILSNPDNTITSRTTNQLNASIESPLVNRIINKGESLNFLASDSTYLSSLEISYLWSFDGVRENSQQKDPGLVTFNSPGEFNITLTISTTTGLIDITPAKRKIIVVDDSINTLSEIPIVNIDIPSEDQFISPGTSILFSGSATHPGTDALNYLWDFNGVAENSTLLSPEEIIFSNLGTYVITFSATDTLGNSSTSFINVTVSDQTTPKGLIVGPDSDLTINAGEFVFFQGGASAPIEDGPITFDWSFDGVTGNSQLQNPGLVVFSTPGVYNIKLTVTNALNISDSNPPTRIVTVVDSSNTLPDTPSNQIDSLILSPESDMTIMAGDSISFNGEGVNILDPQSINYFWNFGGAVPNQSTLEPGAIKFNTAGTYEISFAVSSNGENDTTPDSRIITVETPSGNNPAPQIGMISHIIIPSESITINAGEIVNFTGYVSPANNPPYTYLWTFDSVAVDSSKLIPGAILFPDPGEYVISFAAIDASGLIDQTPAKRKVTVLNPP